MKKKIASKMDKDNICKEGPQTNSLTRPVFSSPFLITVALVWNRKAENEISP